MCEKDENYPSSSNCTAENVSVCIRKSRSREKRQQTCPVSPITYKDIKRHNCHFDQKRSNSYSIRSLSTPTRTYGICKPLNGKHINNITIRSLSTPANSQCKACYKTLSSCPKATLKKCSTNKCAKNKHKRKKKKKPSPENTLETIMQPEESFLEETVLKSIEDDTTITSKFDEDSTSTQPQPQCTPKSDNQQEYLQFALGITEDIIKNENYANDEIFKVFNKHIEENLGKLDLEKMIRQIQYVCDEINLHFCRNDCGPFNRFKISNEAFYGGFNYGCDLSSVKETSKRDKTAKETIGVVIIPKNPMLLTKPPYIERDKSSVKNATRPLATHKEISQEETDVTTSELSKELDEKTKTSEQKREVKKQPLPRPCKYSPLLNKCEKCGLIRPRKIGDNSLQESPGEFCIPRQKCPVGEHSKSKRPADKIDKETSAKPALAKDEAPTLQKETVGVQPYLAKNKKSKPRQSTKTTSDKTSETEDVPDLSEVNEPHGYSKTIAVQTVLEDIVKYVLKEDSEEDIKSGDDFERTEASSEEELDRQKVYTESKPDFGSNEIDRMKGDTGTNSQGTNTAPKKPDVLTTFTPDKTIAGNTLDDLVLVNGPIYIPKSVFSKIF